MAQEIANLTHHQNITDALLNTMGECMAVQQALLHISLYDGKNMPLKTFLQDVENGYKICPEGIRNAFFKGVVAKLRETARDAVSGTEINGIDDLKTALKEYFSPRKTYSHYCAEIQGIRMRRQETVIEYYSRIKRLMEGAVSSLKEKFNAAQVPTMTIMVEGLALESFKRGLSDDLLYAVSVQEPETLHAALQIAQRIERDMSSSSERRGSIHFLEANDRSREQSPRRVHFQDGREQSRQPWRSQSPAREGYNERYDRSRSPGLDNRMIYSDDPTRKPAATFTSQQPWRSQSPAHYGRRSESPGRDNRNRISHISPYGRIYWAL